MIHNLFKERGETPLECIERFKEAFPEHKDESMTYLGRLDPMAEGVLLVGSGNDTSQKRREEFFNLDKEYDFVVLFGFATDTYDILGKIVKFEEVDQDQLKEIDLIKLAKVYEGEREQKYPEYSSKMIAARKISASKSSSSESPRVSLLSQARLSSEDFSSQKFQSKNITIHRINYDGLQTLSKKELFGKLLMDISKVKGDFRQAEILEMWKEALLDSSFPSPDQGEGPSVARGVGLNEVKLAKFSAHVSSGTYIRSLVSDLGNTLGIPTTTFSIKRTRVGDYKVEDSIKF